MEIELWRYERRVIWDGVGDPTYTTEEWEKFGGQADDLARVTYRVRDGIDAFNISVLVPVAGQSETDVVRAARSRLGDLAGALNRHIGHMPD